MYGNHQLALRPAAPLHDVHIEGEKREQKAIQRRTVDCLGPYMRLLQERYCQKDQYGFKAMPPTAAAALKILPPIGYASQPASSYATKFVHVALNKVRCSIDSVTWTPEGRRVVTGSHRGEFTVWNGLTFKFDGILQAHETAITCMRYSHNANWLVTSDGNGRIKYWKGRNELVKEFEAHRESVRSHSFSPNDLKFASASTDSHVKIWDFATCREERMLSGHVRDVMACDWHPSSAVVASGSKDNVVKLWDARSRGEALATLHNHRGEVSAVHWHANGNLLLSAGRDQQLKVYDMRMLKEMASFTGSQGAINCAAWHPVHEDVFASGGHDGAIMYWLVSRPGVQAEVKGAHEGPIWSLAWNPMGHMLATGGGDHCVRFWCRPRPGDPARDRPHADQEDRSVGDMTARPVGNASLLSGAIPGIGEAMPAHPPAYGFPMGGPGFMVGQGVPRGPPGFPGGWMPGMPGLPPPQWRGPPGPPFMAARPPPPPRPPIRPPPPSASLAQRRSYDEAFPSNGQVQEPTKRPAIASPSAGPVAKLEPSPAAAVPGTVAPIDTGSALPDPPGPPPSPGPPSTAGDTALVKSESLKPES